jgi:uroporphyrinogen-III decarboxylase
MFERDGRWVIAAPAYETIKRVRQTVTPETSVIGFAGALDLDLFGGGSGAMSNAAKLLGYRDPEQFAALLDLMQCVAFHLIAPAGAGDQ